jgi:dihydroneopterin aldolase
MTGDDRILIKGLEIVARHGVLPEEAVLPQRFALDIAAYLDLGPAGRGDDLALSVSYADMTRVAQGAFTAQRFQLIEAAAEAVAAALLAAFNAIDRVDVEVRKPGAPIEAVFGHVGVAISRARS